MLANDRYIRSVALKRDKISSSDVYPFCIPAIRHLDEIDLSAAVTFLIGENGSGKSTLLEAIAVAFGMNPEGGGRNFNFETRASHSELHEYLLAVKGIHRPRDTFFLRAESYFNLASEIDRIDPTLIDAYGGISLHEQSHGESFLALLQHRLGGGGLYIFDEPEAALSPSRQLTTITLIDDLVRRGSQFIIATHSPILMAFPHAVIYECANDGVRRVAYENTEHFQITHDFLNNPERMLGQLLPPEQGDLDL